MSLCPCINETENKLADRVTSDDFASQRPKSGVLLDIRCQNVALILSGDAGSALSIPFISEWGVNGKRKEVPINMIASFCPFCGKRVRGEEK